MNDQNDIGRQAERANSLFQQGRLREARDLCEQLLEASPNCFDALHLLGVIMCQGGQLDRALQLLTRAVNINPQGAQAHNNQGMAFLQLQRWEDALVSFTNAIEFNPSIVVAYRNRGRVLQQLKRLDEAIASFDAAIQLKPDDAEAHLERALVLKELKRTSESIASLNKAIQLRPDFAEAYNNLGNLQRTLGQFDVATTNLDKAIDLAPNLAMAHYNRAELLRTLKQHQKALASYDRAIELSPGERGFYLAKVSMCEELDELGLAVDTLRMAEQRLGSGAALQFHLSRLAAKPAPHAAPEAYIRSLFDDYADNFESHLVEQLQYRGPELIEARLFEHTPARALDILDLGCGTGLMGSVVAKAKRTLVGVDLSPNMISKARDRNVYDELHVADIVTFLSTCRRRFDVALAADVMIYTGDLLALLSGVHLTLLPSSGLFAFSVERCDNGNFALNRNGRYSHSKKYVEELARSVGFQTLRLDDVIVRHQNGSPVDGFIAVLRALDT